MPHQGEANDTARRGGPAGHVWMAAAAVLVMLIALATAWYLWFPPGAQPFHIRIEAATRDNDRALMAPPDRPLVLHLPHVASPASPSEALSCEVLVTEASSGAQVFSQSGIRSTGESGLRVEIPRGLPRAGRYDVRVIAHGSAIALTVNEQFHFFVAEAP